MHGRHESIARLIAGLGASAGVEVGVCPPFVYIPQVIEGLAGKGIGVGGQDVSLYDEDGPYTGEVSAAMLADLGCSYAIVGHSERRTLFAETDGDVARKFTHALQAGLIPILCVGETLAEREQGVTEAVIARQLDAVLELAGIGAFERAVIAYEPVWAIGTGRHASPEQAQAVHAFIRARLGAHDAAVASRTRIQYGGSVKADNAAELMAMPDIDGGLIGGASLKAEEFMAICAAAGGAA